MSLARLVHRAASKAKPRPLWRRLLIELLIVVAVGALLARGCDWKPDPYHPQQNKGK